jgi:hypothetical protein
MQAAIRRMLASLNGRPRLQDVLRAVSGRRTAFNRPHPSKPRVESGRGGPTVNAYGEPVVADEVDLTMLVRAITFYSPQRKSGPMYGYVRKVFGVGNLIIRWK